MIYAITAIIAALGSLAAWVYSLIRKNRSLTDSLSLHETADHIKEWHDRITQQNGVVAEDIRNYEEEKRKFNINNPGPGSGAV